MKTNNYIFRQNVTSNDPNNIREIVSSSGFFSEEEINIAAELAEEFLEKGAESEYFFVFAELDGKTVGYSCFGPIPATKFSFDLYWIAVHESERGKGLGKLIMTESEKAIQNLGGNRVYIETSGREQYLPTQNFYVACNCTKEAVLRDFYAPGDSKLIFVKEL
jgi:GNAT superfamily N-acetyltransferase